MSETVHPDTPDHEPAPAPALRHGHAHEECAANAANAPVLRHLLALGDHYLDDGLRRQAMDVFWSLVHGYPRTHEGELARQRLIQMAEVFDREGSHRIARDIYEQLLEADCGDPVRA